MTSERAQILDPRVRKLADEIVEAQRREIAEMRYLIADVSSGNVVGRIYEDPPANQGSVVDALRNTLISELDFEPMPKPEAHRVLGADIRCTFNRSPEADPILWTTGAGTAAVKLNGVLVNLDSTDGEQDGAVSFAEPGTTIFVRRLGDQADWRANVELIFSLDRGLSVGYRGFYGCEAGG